MKISRFVVESLSASGTDAVFGLPGVHALGLWEALEDSPIRYFGFRHEQAAAHAADGYGRVTGKPGAIFLSTGPGALNSMSALGEALASSSPVVAIASNIPSSMVGKGKGALHEINDLLPAFETVTRYTGRIDSADQAAASLRDALSASLGPRPGPVYLEIPSDVLDEEISDDPVSVSPDPPGADPSSIEEAAKLLKLAARPVIWAGGGVLRSGATEELTTLAELLQAPVITTFMGKGAIPEDNRLNVGTLVRQPEVQDLLRSSDLLLSVGTRFSGMATSNWTLDLPSQHIQIDVDEQELGRNYPLRLAIRSDAAAALSALSRTLLEGGFEAGPGRAEHAETGANARRTAIDRAFLEGPKEMAMLQAVRNALDSDIVTVHDMTIPSYWAAPFLPITVPRTFHYPYGYGSLGFSLPAAIGVAAGSPGKPVVAFSGDGGFMYHCRELATLQQYDLPVIVIVFNDRAWGVLKSFAKARYDTTYGLDLPGPDFLGLAESFGVASSRAEAPEELEKALGAAVDEGKPHLIEVPGTWVLPPPSDYYRK
ncbi:MAG: thiamine pyrophosphate-binding protein [Actinobacteria bacterium]|nr:thiamine pyrophosphate-binding protein [Actinomycetota bacterium]